MDGIPIPEGSVKHVGRGRIVHENYDALMTWRHAIAWNARAARPRGWPTEQVYEVDLVFYLPRPATLARYFLRPFKKPDLDKLVRAVLDGMTKVIYADDARVTRLVVEKRFGVPHVDVTVLAVNNDARIGDVITS